MIRSFRNLIGLAALLSLMPVSYSQNTTPASKEPEEIRPPIFAVQTPKQETSSRHISHSFYASFPYSEKNDDFVSKAAEISKKDKEIFDITPIPYFRSKGQATTYVAENYLPESVLALTFEKKIGNMAKHATKDSSDFGVSYGMRGSKIGINAQYYVPQIRLAVQGSVNHEGVVQFHIPVASNLKSLHLLPPNAEGSGGLYIKFNDRHNRDLDGKLSFVTYWSW